MALLFCFRSLFVSVLNAKSCYEVCGVTIHRGGDVFSSMKNRDGFFPGKMSSFHKMD